MRRVLQALEQRAITATKAEVDLLISDASISIQAYIEDNANLTDLKRSITELNKASSTLQMMQIHGGVLLVDETVKVIQMLVDGTAARVEEAQDVVSRAIIRLSEYLAHVEAGNKDVPLALMPLLNDLRASREAALLSENVLFFPNIDGVNAPEMVVQANEKADESWLRLIRSNFQKTLLACVSGKDIPTAAAQLCKLSIRLQRTSKTEAGQKLWWLASALAQAVAINALPFNASIASLFNALDKQIKLLIELGEEEFCKRSDESIVKNILYYIAIADNRGRIVSQVKHLYKLNEQIPQQQEMDELRQQISAPSSEVLITVSKALLEDVASAKDCIELFIHSDLQEQKYIERLYSGLQRISDTLSMIGIEEYKSKAEHQIHEVELLKTGDQSDVELVLLGVSEVILEIETCINNFIEYRINFQESVKEAETDSSRFANNQYDNEHKAAFSVTVSEVLLRIEQTKELLTDIVHIAFEEEKVQKCVQNFKEIGGVISVIDLTAPVGLIKGIANYIASEQFKQDAGDEGDALKDLADCVVGLQCYFEQLESRVPYAEQILEHCEVALERITQPSAIEEIVESNQVENNLESNVDLDFDMTMMSSGEELSLEIELPAEQAEAGHTDQEADSFDDINSLPDLNELTDQQADVDGEIKEHSNSELEIDSSLDIELHDEDQDAGLLSDNAAERPPEPIKSNIEKAELAVLTGEADPILVETFIEEADQVVVDIRKYWNAWLDDQKDWDSFAIMRRGYHTLKGSGRFVGAELLSEFGWQLENLCNKCLGKKEPVSELRQQLLQKGVESAYTLVQQLKNPTQANGFDVEDLIQQIKTAAADIDNVATPTPLNKNKLSEAKKGTLEKEASKTSGHSESLQDELTGIFTVEATQHIKAMREAVGESTQQIAEFRINDDLLRTVHTMRGSARTAGIKHISNLCEPLEEIIGLAIKHEIKFTDEHKKLVQSCVKQIEADLAKIEKSEPLDEHDTKLAEQLQALSQQLLQEYSDSVEVEAASNHVRQPSPSMVDHAQDRDEELCEIFYEEAEDLLLESQASLQKFKADHSSTDAVSELQRKFHTLKGSSRMAGLTTIGELSHVTESLLIAMNNGVADGSLASTLLQRVLDTLHADIELAQSNQDIYLDDNLVAELKAVSGQESESIEVTVDSPNQVEAAVSNLASGSSQVVVEESETSSIAELDLSEDLTALGDRANNDTDLPETNDVNVAVEVRPEQFSNEDLASSQPALKKFINVTPEVTDDNQKTQDKHEVVRVPADVLDGLVNDAGEVNIQRSRLEQVFTSFVSNSGEFEQIIGRLREQLRKLEIETEAQILFKHADDQENLADFDPLELDRYSDIQQLSRSLAESVDDLSNIREMFLNNIQDAEDVLVSQKVVTTNLQDNLLHTRMVRFDTVEPRLQRIIRQTSSELNKQVDLVVEGGDIEIDRRVLNGIITSIEHILRNSVGHGIEPPETREQLGKPKRGQIKIEIVREGSEISVTLKDDGAGIDPKKIKAKAVEKGLIKTAADVSDEEALQLIFKSGLSTADTVSKIAGRGVGMDIVDKDVRRLGGNVETRSVLHKGAKFILKLPFTLAVSHALLVQAGKEVYALTLSGVEGVIQLSASELKDIFSRKEPSYTYAGHDYSFHHLASLLQTSALYFKDDNTTYPVILVRMGDQRLALQVDATFGNKEIVVKPLASQFSQAQGISGATILGDGNVALILDIAWIARLIQMRASNDAVVISELPEENSDDEATIMVVDDSITIRKVTTRFLERNNYKVITAKDGVDALQKLQNVVPDVVLLDIEMPRMDGYELATQMRKEARLTNVPIIMITSRTGDKHRSRAMELGVNCYLGKPYNEAQLLESIREF